MKMEYLKLMVLFIKPKSSKTIHLDVKGSDTIDFIKTRIRDKDGIPPYQQLLSISGKLLDGNHKISEYNTKNEKTLHLILKLGDPMRILILKEWNGEEIIHEADPSDTIEKVKSSLLSIELIPKSFLLFNQQKLEDKLTLADYNIQNNSKLRLKLILNEIKCIIIVKEWNNDEIELKVGSQETIEKIKTLIPNLDSDLISRYSLTLNSQELENQFTFSDYKIENNSKLILKLNGPIRIVILKEWNKEEIILEVNLLDTIAKVKSTVLLDTESRLFYNNVELEDTHLLCDYNIKHESKLNLFLVEKKIEVIIEPKRIPSAHFLFMIDSSKSIDEKKWQAICKSLKLFFGHFKDSDYEITIIAFADHASILVNKLFIQEINLDLVLDKENLQKTTGVNSVYSEAFKLLNNEILLDLNGKITILLMTDGNGEYPETELIKLKKTNFDKIKKFWSMGYSSKTKGSNFIVLEKINSFLNGELLLEKKKT